MKQAFLLAMILLGVAVGSAIARQATIAIPMQQLSTFSGDRGAFYIVNVAVPEDVNGKRLDSVVMELSVDVEPMTPADSVSTPIVGVYPLTQSYNGGGAAPTFEDVVPSARPIALGQSTVVRMDITDIVKGWIESAASNHGLAIGSLTGPEVGNVTLNSTLPRSDSAVRITFFYQDRFGGAPGSGQ
jgi:hypothetical protein